MKKIFEIVEFYPAKNPKIPKLIGSLHVYIVIDEIEIDLRGISVYKQSKSSDSLFFKMPLGKAWSEEENALVTFPLFSFTNVELMEDLKKFVFSEGKDFVLKKLKERPQTRDFPLNPIRTQIKHVDAAKPPSCAKLGHSRKSIQSQKAKL